MARVLLIDDDDDLRDALGEWLVLRGHSVRSLAEGRPAVATAREFSPDVILLDGLLADTPGPAVARELSSSAVATPIVFLSGMRRDDLPPEALVLPKPIDLEMLERTIVAVTRSTLPA